MDVVIRVNEVTRFKDESSAGLATFSLADLMQGDHVEIRGAEDPSAAPNDVIATRLKRENADDEVVLQGSGPGDQRARPQHPGRDGGRQISQRSSMQDEQWIERRAILRQRSRRRSVVKARAVDTDVTGNLMVADEVQIEEIDD